MDEEGKPWLSKDPLPKLEGLPDHGWRVRMDYENKDPCVPFTLPRLHQFFELIPGIIRYTRLWFQKRKEGKKLFIDNLDLVPWKPIYGVPIGGIGCGSIGRGYQGEFCRYQMIPGMYQHQVVLTNQFIVVIQRNGQTIYQQVLSPHRPRDGTLRAWNWAFPADRAHYHGLYPRAWTVYDLPGQNVRLICRQISPVVPHNYQDSSIPAAVFVWSVENRNSYDLDVSIAFTFQNGQGDGKQAEGGVTSRVFSEDGVTGVHLQQTFNNIPCTYTLAGNCKDSSVSCRASFDPCGDGHSLWMDLYEDGALNSKLCSSGATKKGEQLGVAVCVKRSVAAGQKQEMELSLTWHMPVIHFGSKKTQYKRRYVRWFSAKEEGAKQLACYALTHHKVWEEAIDRWQQPILQNKNLPSWYKSALFNELYFVSDGGTVWVDPLIRENGGPLCNDEPPPQLVQEYSKFAWLEGHEYRMYNTYDVHHYASFALICLWPHLQLSLQHDIAHSIPQEQADKVCFCMNGDVCASKAANVVPHDIGDPDEDPWLRVNAYMIHPTQEWKDLNIKFILQVYRDYVATGNMTFLHQIYPACKLVMTNSLRWDTDNDGIIDNAGFADQTYDAWTMKGASAYCGGMWLAALQAFCNMASLTKHPEDEQFYQPLLKKAIQSFESKLWNGTYYNFDCSKSRHHDSIMSDQLAGYWFLKASDVPDDQVFKQEHVHSVLKVIFEHCVLPFKGGTMGAINGMRPDGKKDMTSPQSEEFWTGVTYSIGAIFIHEGMMEHAWQTSYGAYHTCYHRYGLHYQTPEAYFDDRRYRSLGYLRPLAIWAMQYALEKHQPQLLKSD